MFFWSKQAGVKLHVIQPGKQTQNAFVGSFNGKFRGVLRELELVHQSGRRPINDQ